MQEDVRSVVPRTFTRKKTIRESEQSPGSSRSRHQEEDVRQEVVDLANPRKRAVVEDAPQKPDCPHTQAGVSMQGVDSGRGWRRATERTDLFVRLGKGDAGMEDTRQRGKAQGKGIHGWKI